MNKERAHRVTEADVNIVLRDMLSGNNRLTVDKFDNLLTAGTDDSVDLVTSKARSQSVDVCYAIARGSGRGWCSLAALNEDKLLADREGCLDDFVARDVVERREGSVRLRVGLFAEWLRYYGIPVS
ncbi:MAG: hypothetical protein IPG88_10995 [Gemmatimonadetes bacterium]|nr:hypothetical protein [Gemmatimonadota bacterium]